MNYLTLLVRDGHGKVLYESDTDASIFNIPATYLYSLLCLYGYMSQQEYYSISTFPHFNNELAYPTPKIEKFTAPPQYRLKPGIQIEIDPDDYQVGTPVKFVRFIVITQGRLVLYWDIKVEEMVFLTRMVNDALIKGGYLKVGGKINLEFLAVRNGEPRHGEEIYTSSGHDDGFQLIGNDQEDLPLRKIEDYVDIKSFGGLKDEDPYIFIQADVLNKIIQLVKKGMSRSMEVAGIMLGQPYREANSSRLLIEINEIIEAKNAPATLASVQFTVEVQDELDRIKSQQYPDAYKIGWYHSHPIPPVTMVEGEAMSGVFFSQMDQRVHRQFRDAWQIAMVIDGAGRDAAFYRWTDSSCQTISECRAFFAYSKYNPGLSKEV